MWLTKTRRTDFWYTEDMDLTAAKRSVKRRKSSVPSARSVCEKPELWFLRKPCNYDKWGLIRMRQIYILLANRIYICRAFCDLLKHDVDAIAIPGEITCIAASPHPQGAAETPQHHSSPILPPRLGPGCESFEALSSSGRRSFSQLARPLH